jgi:hypothetical protein
VGRSPGQVEQLPVAGLGIVEVEIAVLADFLASYPVNWWLLRAGPKDQM